MERRGLKRWLAAIGLLLLLSALYAGPVLGADIRANDVIVIDEDVDDDLYVAAATITVNATIHGDLLAAAGEITINGAVEGDFWGAGGRLQINGTVADDVRFAGSDLRLGSGGRVGDDLFAAGFGFAAEPGSSIAGDVFAVGYQAQLGGEIGEDAFASVAGLAISGHIVGDVTADVAEAAPEFDQWGPLGAAWVSPWMPARITAPGLRIADGAKIDGDLTYTSPTAAMIPGDVVGGATVYQTPVPEEVQVPEVEIPEMPAGAITVAAVVAWFARWVLGIVRTFVTLLIVGLLVLWLARKWLQESAEHWKKKPLHSLGWGVAALLSFVVAVPILFTVMLVLDIFVGLLTLGGLVAAITGVAMVAESALVVGFWIVSVYLTKVAFSYLLGWIIVKRTVPAWNEKAMGLVPFLIGLAIFVAMRSIPFVGWFLSLSVTVFGLGAIWMLAWTRMQKSSGKANA